MGSAAPPATSTTHAVRTPQAGRTCAAPVLPVVDLLVRLAAFALVALGLLGTPLVLLGRFERLPVLLGGAAVVVVLELLWRGRTRRPVTVARRVRVVSVLAVLVAVLSTGLNATYDSQHLFVDGDPAVYAVAGQLLAETGGLRIDTRSEEVFGGGEALNYAGAGFDAYDDERVVRPSFMHLLPQALAVGSWVGGPQGVLRTNAGIGGFALLAVFAFGCRLVGRPEWALVAMTALALTLPQQHFSRGTYSELPAQLLVFAGLALLHDAVRSRRPAAALVAGLVLGASCTARIDAFAYLVPLLLFGTVLTLAGRPRVAGALGAGVTAGAVMGYLDLRIGSPAYLGLQSGNLNLIFVALAVTAVGCAAALTRPRRALALWRRLSGRALAASVTAVVVLLSAYAGLVRPQVETGRNLSPQQPTAVAVLQEQAGLPIDPLRSYDELSLHWLSWYLGPVAVALGLLGLAVLTWRSLRRQPSPWHAERALLALAFVLLLGASTALYLWRPSIIPVHYWATRRFLPVTIPGLLLLAAWLVPAVRGRWRPPVGVAVAVALLVPPGSYLVGHVTERDYVPMLAVVERTCAALEPEDAVLLAGGQTISTALPQTISIFCGVPVAVMDAPIGRDDIARTARAAERAGRRLVVLSPVPDPVVADGPVEADFRPLVDTEVTVVALSLLDRPSREYRFDLRLFLAPAPTG